MRKANWGEWFGKTDQLQKGELRRPFMKLFVPAITQNMLAALLHILDTIMIGSMGDVAIASVGLAQRLTFLMQMTMFGLSSGLSILIAQYWGKGDKDAIRSVTGLSLIVAVAASLLYAAMGLFAGPFVMSLLSPDPLVINVGADYLRIAVWSYPLNAITIALAAAHRSVERPQLPLVASVAAIVTNTGLNYVLIYGKFGFPALGAEGAAVATVIASAVELLVMVGCMLVRKSLFVAPLRTFRPTVERFRLFVRVAMPVLLNEWLWSLGVTVYQGVFGRMGTDVAAAANVFGTVEKLTMVISVANGNAAGVLVGKSIGQGNIPRAKAIGGRCLISALVFGALTLGIVYALRPLFLQLFNVSDTVRQLSMDMIGMFCMVSTVRFFNCTSIIGVMRAGGDPLFGAITDIVPLWVVSVPLTMLAGLVWQWPIDWVYFCIGLGEFIKMGMGFWRFRGDKWIRNYTASEKNG